MEWGRTVGGSSPLPFASQIWSWLPGGLCGNWGADGTRFWAGPQTGLQDIWILVPALPQTPPVTGSKGQYAPASVSPAVQCGVCLGWELLGVGSAFTMCPGSTCKDGTPISVGGVCAAPGTMGGPPISVRGLCSTRHNRVRSRAGICAGVYPSQPHPSQLSLHQPSHQLV